MMVFGNPPVLVSLLLLSSFQLIICWAKNEVDANNSTATVVFPVNGNVYPIGYYSVSLKVGNPPKTFDFDIDTGSDLTWIQCDAPCIACTKPPDQLYKPHRNLLPCQHPLCRAVQSPSPIPYHCDSPNDQCDYEIHYADNGSSLGVLVVDYFPLKQINGSLLAPPLTFGCGYNQKSSGPHPYPPTAGVLGLGRGTASIVSQLQNKSLMRNVLGHCLSSRGGGFLFFGDGFVNSPRISWTPISSHSSDKHYSAGPAEILFGGRSTGMRGLQFIFDSGSSYTYFSARPYQVTLELITNTLRGTPLRDAPEEAALDVCWKHSRPIGSIRDIKHYFMPLAIKFTGVQLQLRPEDYLIVTERGNVCLGILNGTEIGLESDENLLGDISLQDKIVIYHNENQQIGWVSAICNATPKP